MPNHHVYWDMTQAFHGPIRFGNLLNGVGAINLFCVINPYVLMQRAILFGIEILFNDSNLCIVQDLLNISLRLMTNK